MTVAARAGTTQELAGALTTIRWEDLPHEVIDRTKDLFLDWIGSALAGRSARPVHILDDFAARMGPRTGPSEILPSRRRSSPLFAALVNGASSHVVEQDDLHNASVLHPATVVFPAVLAAAQDTGASGRDFLAASVTGYEAGTRIGVFLGRSHYRTFHTTGTAGTLAAAAGVAHLLGADEEGMLQALGSAGTQAAGLWEFLRDAADSKQLHTAKAAADGLLAAYLAADGFTGARNILGGPQGMAAGMSSDADPDCLLRGFGQTWAVLETSFKFHASCRHTHPAADALLQGMRENVLSAADIRQVRARVHGGAIDVLGPVTDPQTIHQSKFSMGYVLALIALRGSASVTDFNQEALRDPAIRAFHDRVTMIPDAEIDAAYPERWIGLVEIETNDGRTIVSRVDTPRGDPDNTLTPDEIDHKLHRLAAYGGGATLQEIEHIIARVRALDTADNLRDLLLPA